MANQPIRAQVAPETMPVIAHQGVRVITTTLLSRLYGASDQNIQQNFANNLGRFEEGKHYFKLEGAALREFKHCIENIEAVNIPRQTRNLILWTERGAARHAKMLDTEQAWEVFERLEDCYFGKREAAPHQAPAPALLAPTDELPKEIRTALNRKAHALAMEAFDDIRARLEQRLREQARRAGPGELLQWLDRIGGPDAELVILGARELWELTASVAVARMYTQNALDQVHALEELTGRPWYGRPKPT